MRKYLSSRSLTKMMFTSILTKNRIPKVLIVEDDPVFRRVMSFTVSRAGFRVENAANGLDGFERFMQGDIDFIVTDLQMPRSSGIELLERINSQTLVRVVPTILCTAKGFELDTDKLMDRFGLVDVLRKPFSPRRLSALIAQSLLHDSMHDSSSVSSTALLSPTG